MFRKEFLELIFKNDIISSNEIDQRICRLSYCIKVNNKSMIANEKAELEALIFIRKRVQKNSPNLWQKRIILIPDTYFEDYIRDELSENYNMPTEWPFNCLDYDLIFSRARTRFLKINIGNNIIYHEEH